MKYIPKKIAASPIGRRAYKGAVIGFVIPVSVLLLFFLCASSGLPLGDYMLTFFIVISLALLELPPLAMAKSLNIPVQTEGSAFILVNFNLCGYLLMILFWMIFGALLGLVTGIIHKMLQE